MKTRFWIILFAGLMAGALILSWLVMHKDHHGQVAGVYSDGELVRLINLSEVTEPFEFTVTYGDSYNTIYVSAAGIYISEASCPDQICVRHGPLGDGPPIVCLPNRLVIRWESERESEYDAMTGI